MDEWKSSNPFGLHKASHFTDSEILQYWVEIGSQGTLESLFKPKSRMPMMLLGGKGSGKTHLMRYFSSSVRKLQFGNKLVEAVTADKYLGIYMSSEGLNVNRFSGRGASGEEWNSIFNFYFELWLATHLLRTAKEIVDESNLDFNETGLIERAKALFLNAQPDQIKTLQGLFDHIMAIRKQVDFVVLNLRTNRSRLADIEVNLKPGELVFGLPKLLAKAIPCLADALFVFLIDEVENYSTGQQTFLNALIRYRSDPVTFKIGTRLYGIKTLKTHEPDGEENRVDSEFERVELDAWLRDHDVEYRQLAVDLVVKRLMKAGYQWSVAPSKTIVSEYFESLDPADDFRVIALKLVEKYDTEKRDRPHVARLRSIVRHWGGFHDESKAENLAGTVVERLRMLNDPLLEKVNIYLLFKDWDTQDKLLAAATRIQAMAAQYLANPQAGTGVYWQAVNHFRSDMLAQLYRDCEKQHVVYAGFETLIDLSQGIPRNLLALLNNIFQRSDFAGEKPFTFRSKISIESQLDGILDASRWFWSDAKPDSHGPQARNAVEAVAELFSAVRFSLKPAECKLGTFTLSSKVGTKAARELLEHAINWSFLVEVHNVGSDRNDPNALDNKYQLSPMLAPRWEVSEHRRGALQLSAELFNAIFDPSYRDSLDQLLRDRLRDMVEPYKGNAKKDDKQEMLF